MEVSVAVEKDIDELIAEDPFVRAIIDTHRSGTGCELSVAVDRVKELALGNEDQLARIDEAAERIRELARRTRRLTHPRGLTVTGRASWYPGPRENDRNWPRLKKLIEAENWDANSLRDLDDASTKVVAHLADPHEEGFQRRGLVLGYVQSGKTTNFTAVIAKAADAGYSFFIVLSGIHNGLRQQTQDRLSEQLWSPSRQEWHRLTAEEDFRPTDSVDAMLNAGEQKVLVVVKKNATRLRSLKRWLEEAHPDNLARCPFLIIDDEADQASVNTANPDSSPSAINQLIRQILATLPRASYVGYTATPFANVLIDPAVPEDLYPRDFIIDLPRPREYVGPETLFGREPLELDENGYQLDEGHDLIREVPTDELGDLKPPKPSEREDFVPAVSSSLETAVRYFLLSTAARRTRREGNRHATMLVHTSQYTLVHHLLRRAIGRVVTRMGERLQADVEELLADLQALWEEECARVPAQEFGLSPVSWEQVRKELPGVIASARVIEDNSRSEDRLDYGDANQVVIAVGGNTLSRGLTLEGLSVSYFVRSASAYDTLLQMGRWFGYRRGYADLTRIWMTDEMRDWFRHLATVEQEIRYDIERYEAEHRTPTDLGVRIKTHPKLAITAAAKMQKTVRAQVSYSGRRLQTILFNHRDRGWLEANLEAGRELVRAAAPSARERVEPRPGTIVFKGVDSREALAFIDAYGFHERARDLDSETIRSYIERRLEEDELTRFSIAVLGLPGEDPELGGVELGLETPVPCINRARLPHVDRDYADIKALMSLSDRFLDLDVRPSEINAMTASEVEHGRDPAPTGRGDGSGLLVLYPISKDSRPLRGTNRRDLEAVEHVLGVGLVFPTSEAESAGVEYKTVDLSSVPREEPDEEDELDENEEPVEG
jgi:Z1 domain